MKGALKMTIEKVNILSNLFQKTFGISLHKFRNSSLVLCGVWDFDIIKFDDYLHTKGYSEEKDGSMSEYINTTYGDIAKRLIEELLV